MKMKQQQFRIGQLADELNVKRFVIRFWEKEFNFKSDRSDGGQRFYTQKDLETFKQIKTLLYEKGFTIAGAKKVIKQKDDTIHVLASTKTNLEPQAPKKNMPDATLTAQIEQLHKQLIKLRELL